VESKHGEWAPSIPIVSQLALVQTRCLYQFERNFVYRTTDDNGGSCSDPWSARHPAAVSYLN
jgi:hypothetical protein